jgi:hydrogenase/urease accessory protein HupE
MRWAGRVAAVAGGLTVTAWPSGAEAHLVTSGLGPLYDGLLHFALTPEDLVPTLALALLAGLRGAAHGRRALFVLPAAWLVGSVIGLTVPGGMSPIVASLYLVVVGALVAADARLPLSGTTALVLVLGLGQGYVNGSALAWPGPGAVGLLGVVAAVFTVVALAASCVVPLRALWARVVVRVAGSWIAAIGLLLFGWGIRPGA